MCVCVFVLFFFLLFFFFDFSFSGQASTSTDSAIQHVKGVKKVRSAIHQRKYAGQILAEYFAFSIHRWSSIILYNVLICLAIE